jgi:ribosomal protein L7/L12
MSPVLLVIAIVVVITAFWVTRRFMGLSGNSMNVNAARSHSTGRRGAVSTSLPDNFQSEIRDLVVQNRKIEAIKRVRKYTGWGLKQAKDYVDSLSEGVSYDIAISSYRNITEGLDDELKSLISQNKKIEAIKLLRKRSGLGLKESKDYIDRLEIDQLEKPQ